jgi:ABC-type lipoprotein release transport system permease subunit
LASSINEAKAVSTLNRDFGEYRFLSIDPVSLIVDETLNSVVVVNIIFAVVGVVFLVLSALLFSSFVKDSINGKEKEINTLRAMGASTKNACKIFVLEALFFALLTTLIGSLFGWGLLICANWSFNYDLAIAKMALYHYGALNVIIILALAVSASLLTPIFHIKPIADKKIIDAVNAD